MTQERFPCTVGLDVRMLEHSGIGTYLRGLLSGMARLQDAPSFHFLGPRRFRPIVPERLCGLYYLRDWPIYSLKEQVLFPEGLRHVPLFHAPHYNFPLRVRGRLVVTLHDLNHLVFQDRLPSMLHRMYARFMHKEAAIRAARILTVSEKSRREVLDILNVPPERVHAIPPGVGAEFHPGRDAAEITEFQKKRGLPSGYFLAVGINKPHKNLTFLIRAMARIQGKSGNSARLVVAGPEPETRGDLEEAARKAGVSDRVLFPGRMAHADMPLLYAGARALIFPSLYEGFGLPPLEAMKTGIPVAASNREPMPEVLGDAALYFNPEDEEALAEAMTRLAEDKALREDYVERGLRQAALYDWKETARKTLDVYREALEDGR